MQNANKTHFAFGVLCFAFGVCVVFVFCVRSFVLFCVLRLVLIEHKKLLRLLLIEVFDKTRFIVSAEDEKSAAICVLGRPGDANNADFASPGTPQRTRR